MAEKTLDWITVNLSDKQAMVTWFIGAMRAQNHCDEYIAECLVVLIPALGPVAMIHPSNSRNQKRKKG